MTSWNQQKQQKQQQKRKFEKKNFSETPGMEVVVVTVSIVLACCWKGKRKRYVCKCKFNLCEIYSHDFTNVILMHTEHFVFW